MATKQKTQQLSEPTLMQKHSLQHSCLLLTKMNLYRPAELLHKVALSRRTANSFGQIIIHILLCQSAILYELLQALRFKVHVAEHICGLECEACETLHGNVLCVCMAQQVLIGI